MGLLLLLKMRTAITFATCCVVVAFKRNTSSADDADWKDHLRRRRLQLPPSLPMLMMF